MEIESQFFILKDLQRNSRVYLQEVQWRTPIFRCPLNHIVIDAVYSALSLDKSIQQYTKVFMNLENDGRAARELRKAFIEEFVSHLYSKNILNLQARAKEWKTFLEEQVCQVADLITMMNTDLTNPSVILLTNPISLTGVSVLPVAIGFSQFLYSKYLKKNIKEFYQMPRITIVKLCGRTNHLDSKIINSCENEFFFNVAGVQFIQLETNKHQKSSQSSYMKSQCEYRRQTEFNQYQLGIPDERNEAEKEKPADDKNFWKRQKINLADLQLSYPLDHNFLYYFKHNLLAEIKYFNPNCVIFWDALPCTQSGSMEPKVLTVVMRLLNEVANCRVSYYKQFGVRDQIIQKTYSAKHPIHEKERQQIILQMQKYTNIDESLVSSQMYDKLRKKEKELLENNFSVSKFIKNSAKIQAKSDHTILEDSYRRYLAEMRLFIARQVITVLLVNLEHEDVLFHLENHLNHCSLSLKFAKAYAEFVGNNQSQLKKLNFTLPAERKLSQINLQASKSIEKKVELQQKIFRKCGETLDPSIKKSKTIWDLKNSRQSILEVEYSTSDQYYVHYGQEGTLVVLFTKSELIVMVQSETQKNYFRVDYRQQLHSEDSRTGCCLVASDNFLYRAFGKRYSLETEDRESGSWYFPNYSKLITRLRITKTVVNQDRSIYEYRLFKYRAFKKFSLDNLLVGLKKNQAPVPVEVQPCANASGIYISSNKNIYIFGGSKQNLFAEHSFNTSTIVITNDSEDMGIISRLLSSTQLIKKRVKIDPTFYCIPLRMQLRGETNIGLISSNYLDFDVPLRKAVHLLRYKVVSSGGGIEEQSLVELGDEASFVSCNSPDLGFPQPNFVKILQDSIFRGIQHVNRLGNKFAVNHIAESYMQLTLEQNSRIKIKMVRSEKELCTTVELVYKKQEEKKVALLPKPKK